MNTNEGIRIREARSCMICGRDGMLLYELLRDRLFAAAGSWYSRFCVDCGLIWLDPCPIDADIGKLYEGYYTREADRGNLRHAGLPNFIWNAVLATRLGYQDLASSFWQKQLGRILSCVRPIREMVELQIMAVEGPPKGRLLDVGCGRGRFLLEMRELGWDVVGVEPDAEVVRLTRDRLGLNIFEGVLEETRFPDNSFDVITMNHVIEHLPRPIETLSECRRILKPNGKLIIITPNIKSLGHRLFKGLWLLLDPPRHLHLFSLASLRTCLEKAGLHVMKQRTVGRIARQILARSLLIRFSKSLNGQSPFTARKSLLLRLSGLAFQAVEDGLCGIVNIGEELVLIGSREGIASESIILRSLSADGHT